MMAAAQRVSLLAVVGSCSMMALLAMISGYRVLGAIALFDASPVDLRRCFRVMAATRVNNAITFVGLPSLRDDGSILAC
jgi:hypothetical protein